MEATPVVVDSSKTQIAVTYDLTDGFAIDFELAPVREEIDAEENYGPV